MKYFYSLLVVFLMTINPVFANDPFIQITPNSGHDPINLVSCEMRGTNTVAIRVQNRSMQEIRSFDYRLRNYDNLDSKMSDFTNTQNMSLDANESGVFTTSLNGNGDESKIICSVTGVTFQSNTTWKNGQTYTGKISSARRFLPVIAKRSIGDDSQVGNALSVSIEEKPWSTIISNQAYIHVRVKMISQKSLTVRSNEFHALVELPGGGSQSFAGMQSSAPYAVRNSNNLTSMILPSFNNTQTAKPTIAATEDLGAIGSLQLNPNVPSHVVITFQATSPIDLSNDPRISIVWKANTTNF
jgi:hypothetical protein